MVVGIEDHTVAVQSRRALPGKPQRELELTYQIDGRMAAFRVETSYNLGAVASADDPSRLLPGPLANDILVALGEEVNRLTKGRRWDVDSDQERTISLSAAELLGRMGRGDGQGSYDALRETGRRLRSLNIVASNGAWRGRSGRVYEEVTFGLIDRFRWVERVDSPGGARVEFTLSKPFAAALSADYRLLETGTYWQIEGDVPRRLYRLLDAGWHAMSRRKAEHPEMLRIPVHYLRDRVPITESKTAHIRRVLDRAHHALVAAGYLVDLPAYEATTPEDLKYFPTHPGRTAKLLSAVYCIRQAARIGTPAKGAALTPVAPPLGLSARMEHIADKLRDAYAHPGLYKIGAEAIPDDDTFFRLVSTARQEHGNLPQVAKFVAEVRAELERRGMPIPPKLLSRETQQTLLRAKIET